LITFDAGPDNEPAGDYVWSMALTVYRAIGCIWIMALTMSVVCFEMYLTHF